MKKNSMKWLVGLLICLTPQLISAEKIGVLHLKPVGVAIETADAVAGLLSSDLTGYGYQVLNPDAMDTAAGEELKCYESSCAADAGLKAKVERVVFGSVSRLGEKYIVQVSVVNVSTRKVVWSGSLAAKTAEDLDTVVKRIAKAIAEGKKVEAGAEVGAITEQEITQEAKRKKSFYATGGNFVYGFPVTGYAGTGGIMGFNWKTWYETPQFAVESNFGEFMSLNAMNYGGILDFSVNFSFFYLFSKEDFSPYIGGGLGPHLTAISESSSSNFGIGFNADGGLVLFRTYDFHIIIDAQFSLNLAKIPNYEGPHSSLNFGVGVVYRLPKRRGCSSYMGGMGSWW